MDGVQILGPAGYERVPDNDEEMLKRALRQRGPISATFNVAPDFFSYMDGIYSNNDCSSGSSHAVLIIGFGTDNGKDYWLI